jgi:hypothetical protein
MNPSVRATTMPDLAVAGGGVAPDSVDQAVAKASESRKIHNQTQFHGKKFRL